MKDSLGDRMKDIENRTRYLLPRRCYILIRIDGKAFHNYTRGCERPFDEKLRRDMQETTKYLCSSIQGCKIGYTQSDEISLLLTDFDDIKTDSWFDGNIQKIVSVSSSIATAFFNSIRSGSKLAMFDSRVWSTSDPWEAYNTFVWRQKDCTRNSIQMVARSLASHKECEGKGFNELNELIFTKGKNYNDYPTDCKRGAFVYRKDDKWFIDIEPPILTQDKFYFFDKIPYIQRPSNETDIPEDFAVW